MNDIQSPKLPGIGNAEVFGEHDVMIAPTTEFVILYANAKGRQILSKKFAAAWSTGPMLPPDWQMARVDDDPAKAQRIIDWCADNSCTVGLVAGDKTVTLKPGFRHNINVHQ